MRRSSGSDVWREVPDFPDYKINKKGDIYNKRIDKVISASPKSKNCSAVNLRKNGKNYLRSVDKLVSTAFPIKRNGEWRSISDYPNYEINENGYIRFSSGAIGFDRGKEGSAQDMAKHIYLGQGLDRKTLHDYIDGMITTAINKLPTGGGS